MVHFTPVNPCFPGPLKWQQFLHRAKHHAGSLPTSLGCSANTHHSLDIEHNLFQTGSGREEAQEPVQTELGCTV